MPVTTTTTGAADPTGTDADDQIRVAAKSKALLVSGIGAIAANNNGGIAGAFALNEITQNVTAFIEDSSVNTAGAVLVLANGEDDAISVALGGAGQRDTSQTGFTVAGSVTLGRLTHNIKAYLGDGAIVHADDVTVEAVQDTLLVNIAGAFSVAGRAAVGLSLDIGALNTTVQAWVAGDAAVTATGDVLISARNDSEVLSIAAALSIATDSSGIGASGSATGYGVTHNVAAWIDAGGAVDVTATGSVYVDAADKFQLVLIAGQGAGGGSAGFGIAASVAVLERTVKAYVAPNAKITALGQGTGITDPGGSGFGGRGLTIDATSEEDILLFAAGGAGGENFGGAASITVTTSTTVTEAYIGDGAQVNTSNAGAAALQSVRVRAKSDSFFLGLAGAVGAASSVGSRPRRGLRVPREDRRAPSSTMTPTSTPCDDISVAAISHEDVLSIAVAGAFSGTASIAGSGSTVSLTTTTVAFAGTDTTVHAGGDVTITATDDAPVVQLYAGGLAYGGSAGIGAAAAILVKNSDGQGIRRRRGPGGRIRRQPRGQGRVRPDGERGQTAGIVLVAVGGGGSGTAGIAGLDLGQRHRAHHPRLARHRHRGQRRQRRRERVAGHRRDGVRHHDGRPASPARWPSAAPPASASASTSR